MKSRGFEKLSLFACLYFAQGLPYGFFTQALPVFLREAKASLAAIGGASLLTLPWALKFLWAPLADRYGWPKLGLRRSWILPLQAASVLFLLVLSLLDPRQSLVPVLVAFLFCNLFAAAQDVATDGLAVDLLKDKERGWANGVQVGAYRVGMIVGGSVMLFILSVGGWSAATSAMAVLLALATLPVLFFRENDELPFARAVDTSAHRAPLAALGTMLQQPGIFAWLALLLVYKAGHQSASAMIRPWLVDQGYSLADIGQLMGLVGSGAGLFGAVLGGWVAGRFRWRVSLPLLATLQALATFTYLGVVLGEPATWKVALAAAFDNGVSGVATVALFAAMMDHCRPQHSASDYTLQACAVVVSQTLASSLSGLSAEYFGYEFHFAAVCALGIGIVAFSIWVLKRQLPSGLSPGRLAALALIGALAFPTAAHAQAPAAAAASDTAGGASYEIGIGLGPMLPSRIPGVREVMNGWALRGSMYTSKGVFELEWYNAVGNGALYNSNSLDYRLDIDSAEISKLIPVHFLLGLHVDYYKQTDAGYKIAGGWHYGGGMKFPLTQRVFVRSEFKQRFSPGNSLIILVGFSMVF